MWAVGRPRLELAKPAVDCAKELLLSDGESFDAEKDSTMRTPTGFLAAAMATTLLTPFGASADPAMECDGTSQVEIRQCLDETLARADAAVDEAFSFALTSAAETDEATGRASVVPALYASQSAWETFRESQCDYVGSTYGGGSGTGIAILACRITEARARTTELMSGLD